MLKKSPLIRQIVTNINGTKNAYNGYERTKIRYLVKAQIRAQFKKSETI